MNVGKCNELGQVQADGSLEGGDTLNWEGHRRYLTGENYDYCEQSFTEFFSPRWGKYVRHPRPEATNNGFGAYCPAGPWGGVISRDQLTGVLACLISEGKTYEVFKCFIISLFSLGLVSYNTTPNGHDPRTARRKFPDVTGPNIWALFSRGLLGRLSILPCLVLDIQDLLTVVLYNRTGSNDPISLAIRVIVAREYHQTYTSQLAWWLLDKKRLKADIDRYWMGWRSQPEMADLYRDKISELSY